MRRITMLGLTCCVAALGAVANAVTVADAPSTPPLRMEATVQAELAQRQRATARRNRDLAMRERAVQATQQRLDAALAAKAQVDSAAAAPAPPTAKPGDSPPPGATDDYAALAKIYEAMKPARAAAVLELLPADVQLKVAQRMKGRSTAVILAAMSPVGAAILSTSLARGRVVPVRRLLPARTGANP